MVKLLTEWINDQARRQTPLYELAMDNRIYAAVILLAIVIGVLSGIYG